MTVADLYKQLGHLIVAGQADVTVYIDSTHSAPLDSVTFDRGGEVWLSTAEEEW